MQVKAQGGLKTAMFNAALAYKQAWMRLGWKTTEASPLANRVFFSKTQVRVIRTLCAADRPQGSCSCQTDEPL
jgi:hypothetical protein